MPLFTVSLDTSAGELEAEIFKLAKADASGELTGAVMRFISDKILAPGDIISIKCLDDE
ncbi:MAG: hypothetical protein WAM53_04360 [Terrimicrobiaceae bacterium]